jgi:uncharacterized coiled-coil protein SlyX
MSEFPPGTFQFAERIMDLNVERAHRDTRIHRLRRQITAGQEGNQAFYHEVLAWLGQRLTRWGERLQERYSTEGSAPRPRSAKSLAGG